MIPKKLRNAVLHHIHSAHQGTTTMQSTASKTIYWPGINNHIKNMRDTCHSCSYNAPSHFKETLILTSLPNWPFQKICGDYFESKRHCYLTITKRFSGWICIYHFPNGSATSNNLINQCRILFMNYGAQMNSFQMVAHNSPWLPSQSFYKSGVYPIIYPQLATLNPMAEQRQHSKPPSISFRKTLHPMDSSTLTE